MYFINTNLEGATNLTENQTLLSNQLLNLNVNRTFLMNKFINVKITNEFKHAVCDIDEDNAHGDQADLLQRF